MPVELSMVPGGGTLQLRDAEPYSLAAPTTISGTGDDDSGALSGLSFSTPTVEIAQDITSPLRATVHIEAAFSTVAPGSGTVDVDGNVSISQAMTVALHIDVIPDGGTQPLSIPGDCTASPVNLTLTSTAPYDPDTGRVTLEAGDFTIPEIPANANCDPLIAPEVNAQLKGAGHTLSLLVEGDLPVPPDGICDTTTTLAVVPAGTSRLGVPVTLTSATAPDPADAADCAQAATEAGPVTGFVDYLRGSTVIGSGEIAPDGTATLTTDGLPAGNQTLTARYRGSNPYIRSTSAPVAHLVTVAPQVTTDLPPFLPLGQTTEFTYTVSNSGLGEALEDVHVNLTLRVSSYSPTLERLDGETWVPVPVVSSGVNRMASFPAFDLAPGAERTERLRYIAPASPPAEARTATATFEVVPDGAALVPEPNPAALGRGQVTTNFVVTDRVASQLSFNFPDDPIEPHTVRQGGNLSTAGLAILPFFSGNQPGGTIEFLIDGHVVPVAQDTASQDGLVTYVRPSIAGTIGLVNIPLSPSITTGTHQLTVRYSGDATYLPTQSTHTFTVLPARGPSYVCGREGVPSFSFQVNVEAQANLPASATPGTTIELGNLGITVLADRSFSTWLNLSSYLNDDAPTAVGELGLEGISLTVNGSQGSATGVTRSNSWPFSFGLGILQPAPAADADSVIVFDGETGSFDLEGSIGDVVPVTLDSFSLDLNDVLVRNPLSCTPVGERARLGEVRVAGVDLTVSPEGPVRAGRNVTLTADTVNPVGTGVAEFLDETDTIGVAPVVGGKATFTTDDLEPGDHALKVRVYPQPAVGVLVSEPVALSVLPEFDCAAFAEGGNGAVVRLVYMELLGRCPDQAGFDYWTGRLDGGVSPAVFARSISNTPEAVGLVVDDAYDTMLGRAPDAEGRAFWVERMRSGTGRYDQLLADLASSPEFWSLSGSTRAGFVTRVYDRLLDRAPDAAGLEYWTDRLASGAPRRSLVLSLANQPEPLGRLVTAAYEEILGRTPGGSEQSSGSTFLRGTGDRSGLYAQLIGTGEFTLRAQGFPNFED